MKNFLVVSSNNYFKNKIKKKNFLFISSPKKFTFSTIKKLNPKIIFFPHWHWKVHKEIIKNYMCIGFHTSHLPYGRGGSPIQNLIIRGFKKTQLCAIKMSTGFDDGPVFARRTVTLRGSGKEILNVAYKKILIMIYKFIKKLPKPKKQNGKVTVFKRRKPYESEIKDLNNINKLFDYIRMLDIDYNNFPKAYINLNKFKIFLSDAKLKKNEIICKATIKIAN